MREAPTDSTCDLCGLDRPKVVWRGRGYAIVKCTRCGLLYTVLDERRNLSQIYEDESYYGSKEKPSRLQIWGRRLEALLRLGCRGVLLDVGCGRGTFAKMARERGVRAFGLEASRVAARAASGRGIPVAVGDALCLPFPDRAFDAVTLWNVLEHLVSPRRALLEARRVLRPGGLLAITVPNMEPVPGLLSLFVGRKSGRWRLFKFEEAGHLYHFSRRTLVAYLAGAGFSVLKLGAGEVPPGAGLLPLVARAPRALQRALGVGSPLVAMAIKEG